MQAYDHLRSVYQLLQVLPRFARLTLLCPHKYRKPKLKLALPIGKVTPECPITQRKESSESQPRLHLPSIHPLPSAEKWDPKSAPPRIYVFRKLLHLNYRCHRNTHQHLFFDLTLPESSTAATRIPTDIFDLALPESTHQMANRFGR